ncbi:hypothetical protein Cni_G02387 [Canna indica]|uniref:Uncharacterized protein n=1 Tax=Canna indica TaxID=4628 RepID=A0AAQ3JQ09_9LILI|nr:hypothetical protein Cni_G02387 [Canna indica]
MTTLVPQAKNSSLIWIAKPKKPSDPAIGSLASEISEGKITDTKPSKVIPPGLGKEKTSGGPSEKISPNQARKSETGAALFKEASFSPTRDDGVQNISRIQEIQDSSSDEVFIDNSLIEKSRLNWVVFMNRGKKGDIQMIQRVPIRMGKTSIQLHEDSSLEY